jgi:hypothetical protein
MAEKASENVRTCLVWLSRLSTTKSVPGAQLGIAV